MFLAGDGLIDQEEFVSMLSNALKGNSLQLSLAQLNELTKTLFASIAHDADNTVSFAEFRKFLCSKPELLTGLEKSYVNSHLPKLYVRHQ